MSTVFHFMPTVYHFMSTVFNTEPWFVTYIHQQSQQVGHRDAAWIWDRKIPQSTRQSKQSLKGENFVSLELEKSQGTLPSLRTNTKH